MTRTRNLSNAKAKLREEHRQFEKSAWLNACGSGENTRHADWAADGYHAACVLDRAMCDIGMKFFFIGAEKANQAVYRCAYGEHDHVEVMVAPMMCFGEDACVVAVKFPDGNRWVETIEGICVPLPYGFGGNQFSETRDRWEKLYSSVISIVEESFDYCYVELPAGYDPDAAAKSEENGSSNETEDNGSLDDADVADVPDDAPGEGVENGDRRDQSETPESTSDDGARSDLIDKIVDRFFDKLAFEVARKV